MRFVTQYSIGDYRFALQQECLPLAEDEMVAEFACTADAPTAFYQKPLDVSMLGEFNVLKRTGGYELLETQQGLFLLNHWCTCRFGYGIWLHELDGPTPIYVHPEMRRQLPLSVSFLLGTVGLHHKLLQEGALVIHASYIEFMGKGILFLGPSGTGKSTQARLWNEHVGTPILNGDRALLRQKDGIWHVYGYPCCGSSHICVNRTLPLGAVVVLRQAPENRTEPLSMSRKLSAITTGSELYPWDESEIARVFTLAESLAAQIPVVQLCCRADARAVSVLKQELEKRL